jgi:hypothetical protein
MTKKKIYKIQSEGDMESVIHEFYNLRKSKAKKKIMDVVIPTQKFSNILITNLNNMFSNYPQIMGDPSNYHLNIHLEKEEL